MSEEVEDYVDYCQERLAELKNIDPQAVMLVEVRLSLAKYVPEGFGTADAVLIGAKTLEVADLKFGKGVAVSPENNPQLKLYALGAYEEFGYIYDIDTIRITIAQVRLGPTQSTEIPLSDLLEWGEKVVKPTAAIAYAGEGNFKPGSWCNFCKFKAQCRARANYLVGAYDYYVSKALTPAETARVLTLAPDMESWLKNLKDDALVNALAGTEYPGFKVVAGRSNRKIIDEDGLYQVLLEHGYKENNIIKPKAIETITNLEKLTGKAKFAELSAGFVDKPPGKPVLVPISDKRLVYSTVEEDFEFN